MIGHRTNFNKKNSPAIKCIEMTKQEIFYTRKTIGLLFISNIVFKTQNLNCETASVHTKHQRYGEIIYANTNKEYQT